MSNQIKMCKEKSDDETSLAIKNQLLEEAYKQIRKLELKHQNDQKSIQELRAQLINEKLKKADDRKKWNLEKQELIKEKEFISKVTGKIMMDKENEIKTKKDENRKLNEKIESLEQEIKNFVEKCIEAQETALRTTERNEYLNRQITRCEQKYKRRTEQVNCKYYARGYCLKGDACKYLHKRKNQTNKMTTRARNDYSLQHRGNHYNKQ